jgi:hypothetical protein
MLKVEFKLEIIVLRQQPQFLVLIMPKHQHLYLEQEVIMHRHQHPYSEQETEQEVIMHRHQHQYLGHQLVSQLNQKEKRINITQPMQKAICQL